MKTIITSSFLLVFFAACDNQKDAETKQIVPATADTIVPLPKKDTVANADTALLQLTSQVLTVIKKNNFDSLTQFIHPLEGLRFSPYGFVDTFDDRHFKPAEFIALLAQKNKKLVWGTYDGEGSDIKLTLNNYFKKFVYDVDFLHAEKTVANEMLGSGNTLNNLKTIYPDAVFTESYFSGFDKKFEGMDWRSLRLVYKKYEGNYYLIGIVHDQWSI